MQNSMAQHKEAETRCSEMQTVALGASSTRSPIHSFTPTSHLTLGSGTWPIRSVNVKLATQHCSSYTDTVFNACSNQPVR
jgi:hypothetical protein